MIEMIEVVRAIVREGPYDAIEPILNAPHEVRGLTKNAMAAFEDALSKGCVRALSVHGGFRAVPRRTAGGVKVARLWEARTSPALAFSPFTFELCQFLVSQPLDFQSGARFDRFTHTPKTIGDELAAYLTCSLVEGKPHEGVVASQPGIRACALAWLGFPRMLATSEKHEDVLDEARLFELVRDGCVLEGLEVDLARRAERFTRELARITSTPRLLALGQSRERTLDAFVSACIACDRVELASFIVESARVASMETKSSLEKSASLRDRIAARRASGAHLRAIARLEREHEKARSVSFIDETYDAAQLVLARWEHVGQVGFARAASALSQLESWEGT